eukprot:1184877-Lingulodinium_polyedra.AAC.1
MAIQPSLGTSCAHAMLESKANCICRSTSTRLDASAPAFQLMNENTSCLQSGRGCLACVHVYQNGKSPA